MADLCASSYGKDGSVRSGIGQLLQEKQFLSLVVTHGVQADEVHAARKSGGVEDERMLPGGNQAILQPADESAGQIIDGEIDLSIMRKIVIQARGGIEGVGVGGKGVNGR